MAGAEFSWESSDETVATVDASGLVTAVANGSATITATSGSASGSAAVTVMQSADSVAVRPAEASFAALGDTVRLSAEAFDANGSTVAGAEFSWESSDEAVATVDASGLVTAVANGSATITAATGSALGSGAVTVAQEVSAVAVTPDAATVVERDTVRMAATATDANGHVMTGVEFVWASGDPAVAVVDASGLVTGVGTGQTEVRATTTGITGRALLTVVPPVPTAVAVTPNVVLLTALGQTAQLTAEVRDQLGRVMENQLVVWASNHTTVATVDSTGLVTGVASGTAAISATAGSASDTAVVSVRQAIRSATVSPATGTIALGNTLRLVARAYDENGQVVRGASFTWSSSNVAVATVDRSGLVRGTAEGTAIITATAGQASARSKVTVVNPDRAALVALYKATDGPNWVNNDNWLTDAPLGAWYGVTVNDDGRVVELRLDENGLTGEIPSELGDLADLNWLVLSENRLRGAIPAELGDLPNLIVLLLASNALTGEIPSELGGLADLEWLSLSENRLRGAIPAELGDLANLTVLSLGLNDLTGEIPANLGNTNLVILFLSSNDLTGAIPPELGNLANLDWLYLHDNRLTGAIPSELGDLANLTRLTLDRNRLTGAIPSELGDLTNLDWLWLNDNLLTGRIPDSFLELTLSSFFFDTNAGLCAPATSAFMAWLANIETASGPYCASGGPDLTFEDVRPKEVTLRRGGASAFVYFDLANVGDTDSEPTTVRVLISSDSTITTSDSEITTVDIPRLPPIPGLVYEVRLTLFANSNASLGTSYAGACVDPVAGETNTSNNCSPPVEVTVVAAADHGPPRDQAPAMTGAAGIGVIVEVSYQTTHPGRAPDRDAEMIRHLRDYLKASDTLQLRRGRSPGGSR